jgi:hypothetical protein
MRSASTDRIRPKDWWNRAHSALYAAAAMADSFGSMVSIMGRKLQIDAYTARSATGIRELDAELEDFESFRRVCESDALYIVADAQVMRAEERENYKPLAEVGA